MTVSREERVQDGESAAAEGAQVLDDEIARRRAVALEAAWAAAELCAAAYGGRQEVRHKGHLNVVTETDGAAERTIAARLRVAFPGDHIVGEEGSGDDPGALSERGFCWLLDPICGTDNFAHDLCRLYCTNIALALDGEVVLGVVAEGGRPHEVLCAGRGGGAWSVARTGEQRPLRLSDASGMVAFDLGSLPSRGLTARPARLADALIRRNRFALRVLSTSATLAQQARGALAGNVFEQAEPWDLAAGALLLSEAGAAVCDLWGRPWRLDSVGLISGSTPDVHAELVASAAEALADVAR